jgi:methyl-accepting chemotaxis protein
MFAIRSLRLKMLVPALVTVIATLLATAMSLSLSGRSAATLASARQKNLAALIFHKDMYAKLSELNALTKWVGETDYYAQNIVFAENLYYDMADRFSKDGPAVLGKEQSEKTLAALDKYWEVANTDAARRISNRLRFKEERSKRTNALAASGTSAEEQKALAQTAEVDNMYLALYKEFEAGANDAQQQMGDALDGAVKLQRNSILWGGLILLAAAVFGALIAWFVSGATSRPVHTLSQAALRIAQGDLTQAIQVETQDEIGTLAQSFQQMVSRLRELVATLKAASEEMASAAEQLSDHTRAQSAMLERQASGVAETSSTTRELEQSSSVAASRAASVLEVARRAGEMSETGRAAAEESAGELRRIQGSVEGIVTQSTQLLDQARQVGEIVETVRDLATQSHVLSLNASIEAAKAGEAGKSFAVVAQEVRALAEQSGSGATRIGKMVEDILSAVQSTRDMTERGSQGMSGSLNRIRASGDSLREIGVVVRETSEAAMHIASAVQQQSTGITQIALAMRDLDKGMEETVGRIRALEVSAQQVAETATRISGVAAEFRL